MPRSSEPETILIVDDNERNLQVVGSILMPMGYDILPAASGEAAFPANSCEDSRPDTARYPDA